MYRLGFIFFLLVSRLIASPEGDLMKSVIKNDYTTAVDILSSEESKIDLNSTDNPFRSPVLLFAKEEKMTKLLLEYGADPRATGEQQNMSALMEAARNGSVEQAEVLVKASAQVNFKDNYGRTALHYSVGNQNPKFAVYLISKGAFIDAQDYEGKTPLMRAVHHGDHELVGVLITSCRKINLTF